MKNKMLQIALMLGVVMASIGMASAQSEDYGEYALSEVVDPFNTEDVQVAFTVDNITEEDVTIEVIEDGNVEETGENIALDSDGFGEVELDGSTDADQIAVYPEGDAEALDVEAVDFHYDFDTTDGTVDNVDDYAETQEFTDFEAFDEDGESLETDPLDIIPWIVIIAIIGVILKN